MSPIFPSLVVLLLAGAGVASAVPAAPKPAPPPAATRPAPLVTAAEIAAEPACPRGGKVVMAEVVAINQPISLNRLGAALPGGMIFALRGDVCPSGGPVVNGEATCGSGSALIAGKVILKPGRRPRPLVLRADEGQCLQVRFYNYLNPGQTPATPADVVETPLAAASKFTRRLNVALQKPTLPNVSASLHVQGVEWVQDSQDDGSWVGKNPSSLADPGQHHVYTLYAAHEGTYLLYSTGDMSDATGQPNNGLFGALHIEPRDAEWYRSQVSEQDLCLASRDRMVGAGGTCLRRSPATPPVVDYQALYPAGHKRQFLPILNMACSRELTPLAIQKGACLDGQLVHSDLTAVITGPKAGRFPEGGQDAPIFNPAYSEPDRLQPYREITAIYHEVFAAAQAFNPAYAITNFDGQGNDNFAIDYGAGGIGSEIVANRLNVGPEGHCTTCKYEEFFLTSWVVGDPAMIVDNPTTNTVTATGQCLGASPALKCNPNDPNACNKGQYFCMPTSFQPALGAKKATRVLYADDPSNVFHSYISDHTKFRVLHGGQDLHHIHHQHVHQWLHSPDSPNGDYTDSQAIGPGSGFTMEMVYNGSGNVNQTVGDAIFHCHFYPHFAGGMWSMWRVHDVFEGGTQLDATGKPVTSRIPGTGALVTTARALPDGEIVTGTPIPAVVPVPTIPMAPMPAKVWLTDNGTRASVCRTLQGSATECLPALAEGNPKPGDGWKNPGYPFFVPGIAGQRPPHPPMDFAHESLADPKSPALDGGLPRHIIRAGGETEQASLLSGVDFSKTLVKVDGFRLPEEGTLAEKIAMETHAVRFHPSVTPEGSRETWDQHDHRMRPADFVLNGLAPKQGAPYADPCINFSLRGGAPADLKTRTYYGADFQLDASFNKEGWHFPQQRMISLWGDVVDTLTGKRPPEPLFFRANSGECLEYVMANLVPNVYELDDFQVRTPTDILGQHIHLVKFDVTSSDGAANGFNYEDGSFAPDEVTERIRAINAGGGLAPNATSRNPKDRTQLAAKPIPFFGAGPGGRWVGAQATIQRWYADPLFNGGDSNPPSPLAEDRTLRTVFTHDHYGPSTHQEVGVYAGLVIEPKGSLWYPNEDPKAPAFGGVDAAGNPLPGRLAMGNGGVALRDGGPTSWQAVIETPDKSDSFREFLLEMQDTTLTYAPFGTLAVNTGYGGFCSDNGAACQPAAAGGNAGTAGCAKPATAVCYAYGFCSDDPGQRCKIATWQQPESGCKLPTATCNLVAGVPGQLIANAPGRVFLPKVSIDSLPGIYLWGTLPIDPPAKIGPEVIALSGGTNSFSVNYRNEPLYPRIHATSPDNDPRVSDLSFAYASTINRTLQGMCSLSGTPCSSTVPCSSPSVCIPPQAITPLTRDVGPNDPVTPLMRAYAGDDVQVRTLIGGHINPHAFNVYGNRWLTEPSMPDSGWRASQVMGISEHFEEIFRLPTWGSINTADYLWMGGAAAIEQASGNWGLLRSYGVPRDDLRPLPQNRNAGKLQPPASDARPAQLAVCPPNLAPPFARRQYTVVALTAKQALGGALTYSTLGSGAGATTISDPNAILYFKLQDLTCTTPSPACKAKNPAKPEPLVLRANAGDCLEVTLHNAILRDQLQQATGTPAPNLPPVPVALPMVGGFPPPVFVPACGSSSPLPTTTPCLTSDVSPWVGLHPQLLSYDVTAGDGFNAGNNPVQTVEPGNHTTYVWYAGNIDTTATPPRYIPVEFGGANLLPSDTINHYQHGLFGGVVIEPQGATGWQAADGATAVVRTGGSGFREFVLFTQDGLQNPPSPASLISGNPLLTAVNYKSNWANNNQAICNGRPAGDISCILSDQAQCCTQPLNGSGACPSGASLVPCGSQTPTLLGACAGEPVRFRLLQGGGLNTDQVFELYGHVWAETPYMSEGIRGCTPSTTHTNLYSSTLQGDEHRCTLKLLGAPGPGVPMPSFGPTNDSLTDWQGSRMGHAATNHFDILLSSAGGANAVPGDYLYRSFPSMHFDLGLWGIFRVNACTPLSPPEAVAAAVAAGPAGAAGGTAAGGGGGR